MILKNNEEIHFTIKSSYFGGERQNVCSAVLVYDNVCTESYYAKIPHKSFSHFCTCEFATLIICLQINNTNFAGMSRLDSD